MRNLIKSLCSCQTQWHLRQLGGARRQQRLRDGSGGGSGGKCNCHKLAQAASKDTLLISGGALRNKRRSSHTNQHPNVSMRIWIWEYEFEYLNRNMRNWIANRQLHPKLSEASKHLHLLLANSIGRLAPTLAFVYDRHIFVINRRMPQLITCRTCRTLDRSQPEISQKVSRKLPVNRQLHSIGRLMLDLANRQVWPGLGPLLWPQQIPISISWPHLSAAWLLSRPFGPCLIII